MRIPRMPTKKQILRALRFLRITDEQDNLSITNIAIVATLIVALNRPELSVTDIGAFVAALAAYQLKKFSGQVKPETESEDIKKIVSDLQAKVVALQLGGQLKR